MAHLLPVSAIKYVSKEQKKSLKKITQENGIGLGETVKCGAIRRPHAERAIEVSDGLVMHHMPALVALQAAARMMMMMTLMITTTSSDNIRRGIIAH